MADLMIDVVLAIASGTEITSISIWWCTVSIPSYEYGPICDVRDRCTPSGFAAPRDRYTRSIAFWLLDIVGRWSILFDPPDPELDDREARL